MLKKVIIGIICFILLVIAGAGIYIYTLDWNKHKALVAQRLTQITGLKSVIDGNLKVEIFPAPKLVASRVKFYSNNNSKTPLVIINQITANLELTPLIDNKFIVQSMILEQPSVNIQISEKGELNWKNVGKNSNNKSGNVEVSFDNVRINNASVAYENLQDKKEYNIPNISATVNAPSLQGPYKTDGKFIHNNSEIRFKGNISANNATSLNMAIENAVTGSKLTFEGSIGEQAKGSISFDTRSLTDIANVIFGENTLNNNYKEPLFFSFQYNYNASMAKLDNFTAKYGKNITGSGNILLNLKTEKSMAAEFNMAQFNLDVLETIVRDYIKFSETGGKFSDTFLSPYSISFKLRSPNAFYKNIDAQNLNFGFNLNNGILDIHNFGIVMPGETSFRTAGKVNMNDRLQYIFNQVIKSKDFRTFASVFDIDLTKQTAVENKKSVFKRLEADVQIKGGLDNFEIYAPKTIIDSTTLGFNVRYALVDGKKSVRADIAASKIIFDKYFQAIPENLKNSSMKDKFIYQLNIIPWNNDILTTAQISIEDAVYNKIPMQDIVLQFNKEQDNFSISNLSFKNIASAQLEIKADIEKAFTEPQFKELSYSVKSTNFPIFASSLGLDTGVKDLFKRKVFAAQGALAGSFNDYSLSSVQKFGDTEFSYTGLVSNPDKGQIAINGDLEMKTNNFTNFVKALNLDYTPDIPVTAFSAAGKIKGNADIFEFRDIAALLGANKINGIIQFDNSSDKPKLKAELDFDKFDATRWFNLSKKNTVSYVSATTDFIDLPAFNGSKIDYSSLNKLDFDIKANAKSFTYGSKTYLTTKAEMKLKKGVLNVTSFETQNNTQTISGDFVLDSNGTPQIKGNYYVSGIKTPDMGGKVYRLSSGILSANGTFESNASSVDSFINELNSAGEFQLTGTSMKGWDFDIIKFDIEQRKSTNGFEKFVRDNLTTGESSFTKISGKYTIKNGVVDAEKVLWQSPVVDIEMKLGFNFKDKTLDAAFDTIYHHASFSDVLKFALAGKLANPELKLDLSDTVTRINETEKLANAALIQRENEKNEKIKHKVAATQKELDNAVQKAVEISALANRFKPKSDDRAVVRSYDDNMRNIQAAQQKLSELRSKLQGSLDEKTLLDIDVEVNSEVSKLNLMPKSLEDNYIVDGKYVYDNLFNKIAWLYNVASNNTAYFNELSEAYVKQIALMKKGITPLSEDTENLLLKNIQKVSNDMERINKLHTKMRDDYLFIVDTTNIDAMQDNNEIAEQALNTMLTYTKTLNKDIVSSIEDFITALELQTRDYDDYMVAVPDNAEEIDQTKPTTSTPKKKEKPSETIKSPEVDTNSITSEVSGSVSAENAPANEEIAPAAVSEPEVIIEKQTEGVADKKKIDEKLSRLQNIKSNLYELINNFRTEQRTKEEIKTASSVNSGGLSPLLPNIFPPAVAPQKQSSSAMTAFKEQKSVEKIENTSVVEKDTDIIVPEIPVEVIVDNTILSESEKEEITLTDDVLLAENDIPHISLTAEDDLIISSSIDIMKKTQNALNDIIEQVKEEGEKTKQTQTEKTSEPVVTVAQSDLFTPIKINIDDYTISESETNSNLKRNPVIALNIGKELTSSATSGLNRLNQKSGTKFKRARYGDVIKSFAGKPEINRPIAVQNAVQNRKDMPTETSLPIITAHSNNADFSVDVQYTTVELEPAKTSFAKNKYVFADNLSSFNKASGLLGKSAISKKEMHPQTEHPQKYLFAANDGTIAKLSGSIGKYSALTVK